MLMYKSRMRRGKDGRHIFSIELVILQLLENGGSRTMLCLCSRKKKPIPARPAMALSNHVASMKSHPTYAGAPLERDR